ncbi:MAG TPA: NADH-quinone oxidoreductase subunit J [Paenalcaligenes sp.]|nr:NADH-quinone oxidoreductase subunit J [Paenalcaligenes sp.]
MTFAAILFYVLALVLVVAAIRVVTASSPVVAVLHLILAFFTAAMMWMTMGAEFLSLLLVVVYVGAVMVMFIFVIMLLNLRQADTVRSELRAHLPLGIVIAVVMILEMAFVLTRSFMDAGPKVVLSDDHNNVRAIGELMFTKYAFAVEVGGVVLLVGMVSAIALTLRRRTDVIRTDASKQVRVHRDDRLRIVSMPSVEPDNASTPAQKGEHDKNPSGEQ